MSARLEHPAADVALLTLARPPVNALDAGAMHAIADLLETLAASEEVRAVVITAEGERAFCAGADTKGFQGDGPYTAGADAGRRFFGSLAALPVPIVAAINGPAVGAGAAIAAECDVLLSVPGATFSIPEVSLGVVGGGSHVKRLAPYGKAQRMLLRGEQLTAEEAVAFGTVARLVERDTLVDAALDVAAAIARLDPRAVREARAIFRAPERDAALGGYHAELAATAAILGAGGGRGPESAG